MPQRVVPSAPVPRLRAQEQRALARARKKIDAINEDLLHSKGLTEEEAAVAARAGLIDTKQSWLWLEEWQKGERESERDIRAGRTQTFRTLQAMSLTWSSRLVREFSAWPASIKARARKQLSLFAENPAHPSLRIKKMGGRSIVWEGRIARGYRFTFTVSADAYVLRRIGPHDILKRP